MKLQDALEIGMDCGLNTVEESIFNIDLHAMNIFNYSEITNELNELIKDRDELFEKTSFSSDSKIEDVLEWIKRESHDKSNI